MIFSGTSPDGRKHIDLIFSGEKTQTRRPNGRYQVGKTYAVQAKRTAKSDPRGRIRITAKWFETSFGIPESGEPYLIPVRDATLEGNYTPRQYEELYEKMYPRWNGRWAYEFEVVP